MLKKYPYFFFIYFINFGIFTNICLIYVSFYAEIKNLLFYKFLIYIFIILNLF